MQLNFTYVIQNFHTLAAFSTNLCVLVGLFLSKHRNEYQMINLEPITFMLTELDHTDNSTAPITNFIVINYKHFLNQLIEALFPSLKLWRVFYKLIHTQLWLFVRT